MSIKIESTAASSIATFATRSASTAAGEPKAGRSAEARTDSVRLTGDAMQLQEVERSLSQAPAMDMKKVEAARAAIAEGRYRIDPERIASRLMQSEALIGR